MRISAAGGTEPRWRRDGRELSYLSPDDTLMVASVNGRGERFEIAETRSLLTVPLADVGDFLRSGGRYDVSTDGQRILSNRLMDQGSASPMTIVMKWTAELKK